MLRLLSVSAIALLVVVLGAAAAGASQRSEGRTGFVFVSPHIAGAPTGAVAMTGFGVFDSSTSSAHAAGLFRCTSPVNQGPLTGCMTGQGVHWSSTALLASTPFKCSTDAVKTGTTGEGEVAFQAKFFRAGDGSQASFTANVIVADHDIAPDLPGTQNVWIQGVGCDHAFTHFTG